MVAHKTVCLRQAAKGVRRDVVRFGRFLGNPRVSVDRLVEGWGAATAQACEGRHVLALQDTSEIKFRTSDGRTRGLGPTGRGVGRGVLLHAMLSADADSGACLGLVSGAVWSRPGVQKSAHRERDLANRESKRWLDTARAAAPVLAGAAMVTVVADRESDLFPYLAGVGKLGFHLLSRAHHDRSLVPDGRLWSAALTTPEETRTIDIVARPGRAGRQAVLRVGWAKVTVKRPEDRFQRDLPESVELTLVQVVEVNPPEGERPLLWRLLTTHEVDCADKAWKIVDWYRRRWLIEQLFRTMKSDGLRIEDSQVTSAEALVKLTAIAAHAACSVLQLVQARDGSDMPASVVFTAREIAVLQRLIPHQVGKTAKQKNPWPPLSLAWAAWSIAKLGGWDGYASSKPPGPITFINGLNYFKAMVEGAMLGDV